MIGIAGMSHLGLNTGICIASEGFPLVGYDPDEKLVRDLQSGKLPVFEPELDEKLARAKGRIRFSSSVSELSACDVIYVALDIKTDDAGASDLSPLEALIDRVSQELKPGSCLVIHSQVPPGFTRKLRSRINRQIHLYYQVETLIFGRAVERVLKPERYIVGCESPAQGLSPKYAELLSHFKCPCLPMRYESAELAKISINMYLVSTVSVTNMLSEVCENIGADWSEIAPSLKLDRRIGPYAYLSPGLGISGGNLERDLATIGNVGREHGADVALAYDFVADSQYRKDWTLRTVFSQVLARSDRATIAVWGLSYKQNTNSVKNSPSIQFIKKLNGIPIRAYDPQVVIKQDVKEAAELGGYVTQVGSALEACQGASALVIMTPWDEFSSVPAEQVLSRLKEPAIIDPFGLLEQSVRKQSRDCRYFRLGARC